jgi:hypothetical protein
VIVRAAAERTTLARLARTRRGQLPTSVDLLGEPDLLDAAWGAYRAGVPLEDIALILRLELGLPITRERVRWIFARSPFIPGR